MLDIDIRIEFDSRWRIGTGTTRSGLVDDETWASDGRHLTIPASHLKRKLREQAEMLGSLLRLPVCRGRLAGGEDAEADTDSGKDGRLPPCGSLSGAEIAQGRRACIVCRIFGSPRVEPGWRFGAGALDLPVIEGGEEGPEAAMLKAAERLRVTHNRIDPWARRVAEDLLFTLEAGRPGLAFTARCTYLGGPELLKDELPKDEVALVVGAVGALESLGARTRRGYGRCRAWVDGSPGGRSHDEWIDHLIDEVAQPAGEEVSS